MHMMSGGGPGGDTVFANNPFDDGPGIVLLLFHLLSCIVHIIVRPCLSAVVCTGKAAAGLTLVD